MTAQQIKAPPQAMSLYLQEITADKEAPAPHDESVNKEDCRNGTRFNFHTDYKQLEESMQLPSRIYYLTFII